MPPNTLPPLLPSVNFYLAAGVVALDLRARKVLAIYEPAVDVYLLPRGRKDWGERLEDTAVREAYEETGYRVKLLAHGGETRATMPRAVKEAEGKAADPEAGMTFQDGITKGVPLTEPIALYQQVFPREPTLVAVVFFFLAEGDSTATPDMGTLMPDENYRPRWFGFDEAAGRMYNEDYAAVVRRAIEIVDGEGLGR